MHAYDAVQLYDLGFGPFIIPVTPPKCVIAPTWDLDPKHRGKAPGRLTPAGWNGVKGWTDPQHRCHDYHTAKLWKDVWGANVGFVAGDGYVILDNDQGEEFSLILRALLPQAWRRYVLDPKHRRDAFLFRVLDFTGAPEHVKNDKLTFRNGVAVAELQVLAHGKQAVIAGVHPGTLQPYVWEKPLASPDDAPILAGEEFERIIGDFIAEAGKLGWILGTPAGTPIGVSAPGGAGHKFSSPPPGANPEDLRDKIAQARALLDEIPNRDVPPGETPNKVDLWLDDYDNKIRVGYALAAFLGVWAHTPEAEQLWLDWGEGRSQRLAGTVLASWKSILSQPLRYGEISLLKLVRDLVPPVPDFPELEPDMTLAPIWASLRDRWAYCAVQDRFIDLESGKALPPKPFSNRYANIARAFASEFGLRKRQVTPPVAATFLARPDRKLIGDLTYAPGDERLIPTEYSGEPLFNEWRPTDIAPAAVSEEQIELWLEHLLFILSTKEERARFLRWCAFVAQCPRIKPHWHYLIMSLQGLGKDTMIAPLKLAVGSRGNGKNNNWHEILSYDTTKNHNYLIKHKLLIVGETAQPRSGHVTAHDINTKLKPLLAAPPDYVEIDPKFLVPYRIPNRLAVIMFSNDSNPLSLEPGQRRVHVINRLGAKIKDKAYYVKLNDWLENGGSVLCAEYLMAYALSDAEKREFHGPAPETDDKIELENLNIHPGLAALIEVIEDARQGLDDTPVSLVATVEELAEYVKHRVRGAPSTRDVGAWLLGLERQGKGVHRRCPDRKAPHLCGVVYGSGDKGRLWLLDDKAPALWGHTPWSQLTDTELIALWRKRPRPPSAAVRIHPKAASASGKDFPDDGGDEPV